MELLLEPELGVPYEKGEPYVDLRDRIDGMFETLLYLGKIDPEEEDFNDLEKHVSASLLHAYARNPEDASQAVTDAKLAGLPSGSIMLTKRLLDEFGQIVVASSVEIRNLIVNKLLLETDSSDARIRLRALEMLGKISDVGLFVEKHEHKVIHSTTEELRESLRGKLKQLLDKDEVVAEGEFTEVQEPQG